MCVIMYLPKKSKEPSKDILEAMWWTNPDGAGIMWKENGNDNVQFSKGYFDFEEFYKDFLIVKRDMNFECAIHFRIATSGGINQEMCHPFSLTNDIDIIKKTYGNAKVGIMHNGIINIDNRPNLNDTCEYIIRKLYPRYESNHNFFKNKQMKNIIEREIGYSKLIFMDKDSTTLFGKWQTFDEWYCSNLYFTRLLYMQ